jgi:Tol biopolymer transport system component
MAIWSPDGSRIAFDSARRGPHDLYWKTANGAGSEELVADLPQNKVAYDWSPDGRFLLYGSVDPKYSFSLWVLPLEGDRKPRPFLNGPFDVLQGQFSPDGRWVAYQSNESGRFDVYVRPFPGPGGQWLVSTAGGVSPRWRADGKELFYLTPDGKLMAVPVVAHETTFEAGIPIALFQTRIINSGPGTFSEIRPQYDVAPDGRFLVNVVTDDSAPSPITLIVNWKPPAATK